MTSPLAAPPRSNDDPQSQSPGGTLWSNRYRPIIARGITYAVVATLAILIIIFLVIPALISPEFRLSLDSSISSLNISASNLTARWNIDLYIKNPSQVIPVQYNHKKFLLNFGHLPLARPSLVPAFTQPPDNVTMVRAKVLSTLGIVNDLDVKGLVRSLKGGGTVTIDVVVKSKRRLHLGPCWVPVFSVYVSCMGVTFTAPTDGNGDWSILRSTLDCIPDIITQLW